MSLSRPSHMTGSFTSDDGLLYSFQFCLWYISFKAFHPGLVSRFRQPTPEVSWRWYLPLCCPLLGFMIPFVLSQRFPTITGTMEQKVHFHSWEGVAISGFAERGGVWLLFASAAICPPLPDSWLSCAMLRSPLGQQLHLRQSQWVMVAGCPTGGAGLGLLCPGMNRQWRENSRGLSQHSYVKPATGLNENLAAGTGKKWREILVGAVRLLQHPLKVSPIDPWWSSVWAAWMNSRWRPS